MTTTTVKVIGTGGDYTTVQAWEDAKVADLVAADIVWQGQLKNQTFTTAGDLLVVAGSTTDATRYSHLTCQAGASFRDNASVQSNALRYNASNGAALTTTGNYNSGLSIAENNFRITGIQFQAQGNAGGYGVITGAGTIAEYCIFEGKKSDGFLSTGFTSVIRNCLFVWRANSGNCIRATDGSFVNCTIVCTGAGLNAFSGNYSAITVKNCAIFGFASIKTGSNTYTFTTCYTDVVAPPSGFVGSVSYPGSFQNTLGGGVHDFRLKNGSPLLNVATTDTTNAPIDIAGTTRPQGSAYDVGCWEQVGATALAILPRSYNARQAVKRAATY